MVTKREGFLIGAHLQLRDALDLLNGTTQTGTGTREHWEEWESLTIELGVVYNILVKNPSARRTDVEIVNLTQGELKGLTKKVGKLLVKANKLASDSATFPRNIRNAVFTAIRKAFEQLGEAESA